MELGKSLTLESVKRDFQEKFAVSGSVTETARAYIPGGFSRSSVSYGPHPIYADHGEGQYLFTIDGHRLLDLHNNFGTNVLGHDHPAIREALLEAVPKCFSYGCPTVQEHKLAQMITERVASVDQVIFTCSASEACMVAVRVARAYTGKPRLAKMEGGFHGIGDDFLVSIQPEPLSLAGDASNPLSIASSPGLPAHTLANATVLPQNNLEACEDILTRQAGEIACVILELQSAAGGLIELDQDFVQGLRDLTRALGILLIVDETITLRCSYSGMQGDYGVAPDLTVMGKIIGGGLPLGAVGGPKDIMSFVESAKVKHSGTHHGHPLATRAGIACLEVMTPDVYARLADYGAHIKYELNRWAAENDYPLLVSGRGSFLGYELADRPGRVYRSARDAVTYSNEEAMQIFALEMANRGVFPLFRGQVALSEPMTEDDIEKFISLAKEIVKGMRWKG
jgi:glutamate-1-semialdehyde 2,1-aminomutase